MQNSKIKIKVGSQLNKSLKVRKSILKTLLKICSNHNKTVNHKFLWFLNLITRHSDCKQVYYKLNISNFKDYQSLSTCLSEVYKPIKINTCA